jgi:hypothetical protein
MHLSGHTICSALNSASLDMHTCSSSTVCWIDYDCMRIGWNRTPCCTSLLAPLGFSLMWIKTSTNVVEITTLPVPAERIVRTSVLSSAFVVASS